MLQKGVPVFYPQSAL